MAFIPLTYSYKYLFWLLYVMDFYEVSNKKIFQVEVRNINFKTYNPSTPIVKIIRKLGRFYKSDGFKTD